jgi:hypothetical protein
MTDDVIYSFTYDKAVALRVFQEIGVRDLVLAVLAGIVPKPDWEGCEVYEGPAPDDPSTTGCVGIKGSAADQVQRAMVEAFEAFDIPVPAIYEGGPEERQVIAKVADGTWVGPE